MTTIYLDYNATTPVAPSVTRAMLPFLENHFGNPSSDHALGQVPREAIARARSQLAGMLLSNDDEIIFTSGGSEANNMALKGILLQHPPSSAHLVISAFEHPAILEPARYLERAGYGVTLVPVDGNGVVQPDQVAAAIQPQTRLVSIMHANNEIGTVQPIREIADRCHREGVLVHTDAAQSIGKIPAHVNDLGVDLLTVAGHKLYAPKGVGALYVRDGVTLEPVIHGAGHERGFRAGTENTAYWVGLGEAARCVNEHWSEHAIQMEKLRDQLLAMLIDLVGQPLTVNGGPAARLPNTLSVNFPSVTGSELLEACPVLCASTGAACHSGQTRLSATLAAIGLDPEIARGTVRLSVGWSTTEQEIEMAAGMLAEAWQRLAGTGDQENHD
ncbi:MAG: cysteine desulfurase family protein [Planctomycetota bacterium]|nr:cysteine desulfurase family protein [Planctomycetota bacterium]